MQVANPVQTFDPLRASMPSVLMTQARMRIPICGKIRPGIKVLTTAACSNPDAAGIYEAGLRSGKSFDDIEALIKKAVPSLSATKFLIPYNVPYFSIFPGDFHNPKVARQILDKYGEDRGDGVKRLYAFDVVFPADTWDLILPHSLRCYGFNELKYWSEFEPDGRTMRCMTRAPVAKDTTGARFVRTFGGRKSIPRPDTNGKCDPETCPQFQDESCTVSGEFVFYIPGIVGLEAFSVPTSSIYSLQNAMKKFQMIISGGVALPDPSVTV